MRRLSRKLGEPRRLGIEGERDFDFECLAELADELPDELRLEWDDLEEPLFERELPL